MKKLLWCCLLPLALGRGARAQAPDSARIDRFMRLNDQGNYTAAQQMLPPSLREKISVETLGLVWRRGTGPLGAYHRLVTIREEVRDTLRIAQARCAFDKGFLTMNFALDSARFLVGFHILGIDTVSRGDTPGDTLIPVSGGRIAGTLLVPPVKGKMPVALIIAGSGPVDRDGNEGKQLQANSYRMLADSLARYGIASLRYDKRFVGASQDFTSSPEEVRLEDFAGDAAGLIAFLRHDRRFSRIVVIGHSEGSLVGMLASETEKPDAFVSLAGAGEPLDRIMQWQFSQLPGVTLDMQGKLTILLDSLRQDHLVSDLASPLKELYNPGVQRFLMSDFKYDPSEEIRHLHIPVLIVNGTRDLQVTTDQAKLLHAARPDAALVLVDGMNHVLKNAPEDRTKNLETYTEPALPLDIGLVGPLVRFILHPGKEGR